jgi:magnesium-transporting ATPase (P-type)
LLGSRPVLLAIAMVIGFQLLFTYTPVIQGLFGTMPLGLREWGVLLLVAVNVLWIVEVEKWVARRWRSRS